MLLEGLPYQLGHGKQNASFVHAALEISHAVSSELMVALKHLLKRLTCKETRWFHLLKPQMQLLLKFQFSSSRISFKVEIEKA